MCGSTGAPNYRSPAIVISWHLEAACDIWEWIQEGIYIWSSFQISYSILGSKPH